MTELIVPKGRELSASACTKAIEAAKASALTATETIQRAAALVACHAARYNDAAMGDKLIDALCPNKNSSIRRDALVAWFVQHGPMRIKSTEKDGKTVTNFGIDKAKAEAMVKAIEEQGLPKVVGELRKQPWNDAKKEKDPFDGFDLLKVVQSAIAKASKIEADPSKKGHAKTKLDGLADLKAFAANLSAQRKGIAA